MLTVDTDLCGIVLDNFLNVLATSCVYDSGESMDRQHIASVQPFTIHCALHEMFAAKNLQSVSIKHVFLLINLLATFFFTGIAKKIS